MARRSLAVIKKLDSGPAPSFRQASIFLAAIGFAVALYQYLISCELSLVFNQVWPIIATVFFCAYVCFGFGSYLAQHANRGVLTWYGDRRPTLIITGTLSFLSLGALLRISSTSLQWGWMIVGAMSIIAVLSLFGFLYGATMLDIARTRVERVGTAAAFATGGYAAGFVFGTQSASLLGVNALLFFLSLSLILIPVKRGFMGVAIVILSILGLRGDLDNKLERFRPVIVFTNISNPGAPKLVKEPFYTHVWSKWSPYAKVDIYRHGYDGYEYVVGAYNYRGLWNWSSRKMNLTYPGFAFIRPTDKIALIGASAGFEARFMPVGLPAENITLIEIDPAVVQFFKKFPEENDGTFNRIKTMVADGRSFIDCLAEKLDVLIIGSADSTSNSSWRSFQLNSGLYSRETVKSALAGVKEDGILLFVPRDERLAQSVSRAAEELGLSIEIYYRYVAPTKAPSGEILRNSEISILMSKSPARLAKAVQMVEAAMKTAPASSRFIHLPTFQILRAWKTMDFGMLTDDSPYLTGQDPHLRPLLLIGALSCVAFFGIGVVSLFLMGLRENRWSSYAYFLLIGCGQMALQLSLCAKWRSCFGNPAFTAFGIYLLFMIFNGLGNFVADRLPRGQSALWKLGVFFTVVSYTLGLWCYIPYTDTNIIRVILISAIILAPLSVMAGLFFPFGLRQSNAKTFGGNLFYDGLGAAFGYILFFLLSNVCGIPATLYFAAICYLCAVILAES